MSISISGNGSITGATTSYSFDQSVSIGGTLTYEDVSNIDSVGIITARQGVHYGAVGSGVTITAVGAGPSLGFLVNDSERVRITSAGLVGIGTEGPGELLHVVNPTTTAEIRLSGGATAANYSQIGFYGGSTRNAEIAVNSAYMTLTHQNSGVVRVETGGTERMRITSAGLVGIGTEGPDVKLHVEGATAGGGGIEYFDALQLENTQTANVGATRLKLKSNRNSTAGETSIAHIPYDGSGNAYLRLQAFQYQFYNQAGSSEYARIDNSGRLLVGTPTSPTDSINILAKGPVGGGGGGGCLGIGYAGSSGPGDGNTLGVLRFTANGDSTHAEIRARQDGATWTDGSDQPSRLVFSTTADGASSPTERMRITSQGGLKAAAAGAAYVSSISPLQSHELTSNVNGAACLYIVNRNATSPVGAQVYFETDKNNTANNFFECFGSSTLRAAIRSNGGLSNYQSNNTNLCDEREKKNIEALDSTWGCLKNWDLKKFHYNEDADTDDKRYGVIAQQVAEHCPEVISDWVKQKAEDAVLDDDGNVVTPAVEEITRMAVKEQQMMWMAIKALQEAQTRIEQLEQRLTDAGIT